MGEGPHQLLVVGAGPVGLVAALAAHSDGVSVVVVEAEPEDRVRPGSRATFIFRESLDLMESVAPDISLPLIAQSESWTAIRSTYKGREIFFRQFPPSPPGQFGVSISQKDVEKVLIARCRELGIPFKWNDAVESVSTAPDRVDVSLHSGSKLTAQYVIGADGARSRVRSSIGSTFDGDRSDSYFVIVDVGEEGLPPMPKVRTFHYRHVGVGRRNVVMVPFGGGWRLDLQLRPGDDPADWQRDPQLSRWITAVAGADYTARVQWVSTYRFNRSVATRYTDENYRVLLTGEAAHLFPPFGGGRGLNSGIADAIFSAHAVAAALRADDDEVATALIRRVAEQRRSAGLVNRSAASAALTRMEARTVGRRLVQSAAAHLAPFSPRFGRWLDRAPMGPTDAVAANSRF